MRFSAINNVARTFLATVVALSMALHVVLGCCWHHTHGHACEANSLAEDHDCADEHEHACHVTTTGDVGWQSSNDHGPSCDEVRCSTVVSTDTSKFGFDDEASPSPINLANFDGVSRDWRAAFALHDWRDPSQAAGIPLPLYVRLRALRI